MVHTLPPLHRLQAFEAAARLTSFKAAAAELGVTASAISHRLKSLESELGVALFERLNREVRLTETGRTLAQALHKALREIVDVCCRLGEEHGASVSGEEYDAVLGRAQQVLALVDGDAA